MLLCARNMKFCNLLRETSEELPEIQNLYVCYKRLKKTIGRLTQCNADGNVEEYAHLHASFEADLNSCIQQINEQFMEKEEQRVIEMGNLEEHAAAAQTSERCREATRLFVDFHGQMLLFIHSAMLGYTALLKILKKYAKKTGNEMDAQRERLRGMPICATEIATSIVRRAENAIDALVARQARLETSPLPVTQNESEGDVSTLLGQVKVALYTWEQLKSTAVTPSTVLANHLATFSVPSRSGSVSMSSSSSVKSESN